jgi:hypothetical protein
MFRVIRFVSCIIRNTGNEKQEDHKSSKSYKVVIISEENKTRGTNQFEIAT